MSDNQMFGRTPEPCVPTILRHFSELFNTLFIFAIFTIRFAIYFLVKFCGINIIY